MSYNGCKNLTNHSGKRFVYIPGNDESVLTVRHTILLIVKIKTYLLRENSNRFDLQNLAKPEADIMRFLLRKVKTNKLIIFNRLSIFLRLQLLSN